MQFPCATAITSLEGRFLSVSDDFLRILGGNAADWEEQAMARALPLPARIFLETHLWPLLRTSGELREVSLNLLSTDKRLVPVLVNARIGHHEGTECIAWVFFVSQERTRFEAELIKARGLAQSFATDLTKAHAFLERAGRLAGVGAWSLELKTSQVEWSDETCRIHEVPLGHRPSLDEAISCYVPAERPAIQQAVAQCIEQGTPWDLELRMHTATGRCIWVRAVGEVEYEDPVNQIKPVRLIGALQDITEQKAQADALVAAKEQAEQASLFKSQFLANMSHEIRTPMNAILGMLKLMHNTRLEPRQRDYVEKTEGAAQSLLALLNDILDFSKVEAGKMTLDPQPFELDALMQAMSVIFSASLGNKPVELLFDIDPRIPRVLLGDSLRLQQILINLGGNAIKFTSRGEVLVQVRLDALEGAGAQQQARLHFAVNDSGIGIAPENQQKIFLGFSQAEASTTRRFGGSGLGLSICRRLIDMMGGQLRLDSAEGRGSTFSFDVCLPVVATPASAAPGSADTHAAAMTDADISVLVVDDNPVAREVMARMGTSLGWSIDTADSGDAALACIARRNGSGEPYRAVFVDWQMPGLDGWQTSAGIRSLCAGGDANSSPVIMMVTAHGHEMLARQTVEVQNLIDGYLVKPVTAGMLMDAMQQALRPGRAMADLRTLPAVGRPLQGLRILLVEDNAINQQVAEELLSGQGAVVDIADNGRRGVEAVQASMADGRPYRAVLMDMQMPVLDGLAATREIRQRWPAHGLPIIAMTANAMAGDREACLAAGMNDHIGKPFDLDRLVATLLQWSQGERDAGSDVTQHTGVPPPMAEHALLNRSDALKRMGGSTSLLDRLSTQFMADWPRWILDLGSATNEAERKTAARTLHSLRGTAATIGADAVAHAAAVAEEACLGGRFCDFSALQELGARTLRALLELGIAAPRDPDAPEPAAPAPPTAAERAVLERMLPLLECFDLLALEVMEEFFSQQAARSPRWTAIEREVYALAFDRASHLVRRALADPT